jgi:glycosyltransferase involved in cell wall biosynthesis
MSRNSNLVSAIIPCYNGGEYISEAVDSIASQTFKNIEIIVVDDGSDENSTLEILNELDTSKTTIYHKENGGPASARNYGIEKSSGKYILTLDSDDTFAPDFVEKGLTKLDAQPKTGMVTSYVKRFKGQNTSYSQLKGGGVANFLVKNSANASLLFRYQCWADAGGYDENIPGFEDWEFFISVTKNGWYVYSIPEYLFQYRDLEGSQFDIDIKKSPEIINYLVKKHKSLFQEHIVSVMYENELKKNELRESELLYKNSRAYNIGNHILKLFRWIR